MPPTLRPIAIASGAALAALALTLASCGGANAPSGAARGGPGGPDAPKPVGFIVIQASDVPVETLLPGRISAFRTSEVRPQISGVIRRRLFTEGALVRAGQALYEIDPRPYRAAAAEAEANLRSAQASADAARALADRYKPLAEIEAVSKQSYTDALAAARQAEAAVAQRRAQVEAARINVGFTSLPAPITGRIGRSLATVGALVTANQATPLAQINQLDPIFVDIQQSAAQLLALRRALAKDGASPTTAEVRLQLEDGSDYGMTGRVQFTETLVDPTTGTVTLRAEFANPDGLLLPGMFVRARFAQSIERNVLRVPQAAVSRDVSGAPQVWVVGPGNKAQLRKIVAPRAAGSDWVVTDGLKAGERVILQGTNNLRPDQPLKPVPADTPQPVAPPGAKGGAQSGGAGRPN